MSNPKKHHYISACYLKNFATPAKRSGRMYAFDKATNKPYPTTPNDSACQNYFNAISEQKLTELEKDLSSLEADLSDVIKNIQKNNHLPPVGSDEFCCLLIFIAFFAIRNPSMRKQKEEALKIGCKITLSMCQNIKGHPREILGGIGIAFPDKMTPEAIRNSINEEKYQLNFPKGYHISSEFKMHEFLTNLLLQRNWGLLEYNGKEEFVTSDNPVTLAPASNKLNDRPLGYESKETFVIFPLTPKLCLIGTFEPLAFLVKKISLPELANINTFVIFSENSRFIYSQNQGFPFWQCNNGEFQITSNLSEVI